MHKQLARNPEKLPVLERTIVAVVIISGDGKILLGRKDPRKGGVFPDAWHLPGGGVDLDETLEDAALRETQEETTLQLQKEQLVRLPFVGSAGSPKTLKTGERVWAEMTFNRLEVRLHEPAAVIPVEPVDDLVELHWFEPEELAAVLYPPGGYEFFVAAGYIPEDRRAAA